MSLYLTKKSSIMRWFLLLTLIIIHGIIINGCANLDTIDTEQEQADQASAWKKDLFIQRSKRIAPIVSKTVILSNDKTENDKNEEEQE